MQLWHVLVRVLRLCRMGAETMETWEIISLLVRRQLCSSSGKKKACSQWKSCSRWRRQKAAGRGGRAESMSSGEKNRHGKQTWNSAGALRQLTEDWPALIQRERYNLNDEDGTCTGVVAWRLIIGRFSTAAQVYDETMQGAGGECVWSRCAVRRLILTVWGSTFHLSENEHQGLQLTRQKQEIGINADCRHKPCRKEKCNLCFTSEMDGLMFYQFI